MNVEKGRVITLGWGSYEDRKAQVEFELLLEGLVKGFGRQDGMDKSQSGKVPPGVFWVSLPLLICPPFSMEVLSTVDVPGSKYSPLVGPVFLRRDYRDPSLGNTHPNVLTYSKDSLASIAALWIRERRCFRAPKSLSFWFSFPDQICPYFAHLTSSEKGEGIDREDMKLDASPTWPRWSPFLR